jgi:hypothetical protein
MEFRDMEVGQVYVLHGRKETRVRLLETPPEVRSQSSVRVEYRTGVHAGETRDIPSRRVFARWDGKQAVPVPKRAKERGSRMALLAGLPPLRRAPRVPVRLPDRSEIYGPEHPTRALDELMEGVSFSPQCLAEYKRLFAPTARKADVPDELRAEIRYKGQMIDESDTRTRVRVQGRFDVVVPRPMPDEGYVVGRLYVPERIRARLAKRAA